MRRNLVGLWSLCLLVILAACGDASTAAPSAIPDLAPNLSVTVDNINNKEIWPIEWTSPCTGVHYASATYRQHLVSHKRIMPDGTEITTEHGASVPEVLYGDFGGRAILQQITSFKQIRLLTDGTYTVFATSTFRLITPGSSPNDFLTGEVIIVWNGSTFEFDSINVTDCRGA